MPVNPPQEYYVAEQKYLNAKTLEEKILALEEMIRLLPKHHGSENALAQLKSRLAKLKKEASTKKKTSKKGIAKEGDAQVCLIGNTMSGKSLLLSKTTNAQPALAQHPYTTTKPEIGMMDYNGIKIQIIEIPATLEPEYVSIARSADLIVFVIKDKDEKNHWLNFKQERFIKTPHIFLDASQTANEIKQSIWSALGLMIVYTKGKDKISPMALPIGATVEDFAYRIHKDFVRNFRFAQILRKVGNAIRKIQAGLKYKLQDGDIVEIHVK
jgi:ribosome-interacting GTPase 1